MADLLYENSALSVFFEPGEGDRVLVTFTHMARHTSSQFWGQSLAQALRMPCIGFALKHPH